MKKLCLLIVFLLSALAACSNMDDVVLGDTHEHTYHEEWKADSTSHWHPASCIHSDQTSEKQPHEWDEGFIIQEATDYQKGRKLFTCVSCGATKTEEIAQLSHNHQFADEYSADDNYHWYAAICGHEDLIEKVPHTWDEGVDTTLDVTYTCSVCGKQKVEVKDIEEVAMSTLEINYQYENGEIFKVYSEEIEVGASYSVESPKVSFMTASQENVTGVMTNEDVIVNVNYKYSGEVLATVTSEQRFTPFMVDVNKGLSISYVSNNISSDWEEMIVGNTFVIYAGCLRYRDSSTPAIFSGDWYEQSAYWTNDPYWNSLLNNDGEMVVTWSFNPDGSIKCYKNGLLIFNFRAETLCSGYWNLTGEYAKPSISTLVTGMFAEIAEQGFYVGAQNSLLSDFTVGYAVEEAGAREYLHSRGYNIASVKYVDTDGLLLRPGYSVLGRTGETFTVTEYEILGYSAAPVETTQTFAGVDLDIKVVYTPTEGVEQLTEPIVIEKMGVSGWNNTNEWAILATDLKGDYTVRVKYNLDSGPWPQNHVWRTVLPIHYDAANSNVRWVCRFDWYGWQDGAFGTNENYGSMWVYSFPFEYLEVNDNCDITATYTRRGNHLQMNYMILSNEGRNAGRVFYWTTSIDTTLPSISLALSCEYSNLTVYSVEIC